jgi:hypothetical protein
MGPLRHQLAVLVNHVQTTVFDHAMACDVHGVGMYQPQRFHRG